MSDKGWLDMLLDDFVIKGCSFITPTSSGMDGYILIYPDNKMTFISYKIINEAKSAAMKLRVGFIRGDCYIGLTENSPEKYRPSQLRFERFKEVVYHYLKQKP